MTLSISRLFENKTISEIILVAGPSRENTGISDKFFFGNVPVLMLLDVPEVKSPISLA